MSTKTTFKRVALVTVAALGFGVLSSVTPASAVASYTASLSLSTTSLTVAGATNSTYGFVSMTATNDAGLKAPLFQGETITATVTAWPTGVDSTTAAADISILAAKRTAFSTWASDASPTGAEATATYNWYQMAGVETPTASLSAASTGESATYWMALKPATKAIGAGTYTIRLRLTDSTGFITDRNLSVNFVSSTADTGAVLTVTPTGTLQTGQTVTYVTGNNLKATLANASGGLIQTAGAITAGPTAPTLSAAIVDEDGVVEQAATSFTAHDTGVVAQDFVTGTTDSGTAWSSYANGTYGIVTAGSDTITVGASLTSQLRVRYGSIEKLATLTIVDAKSGYGRGSATGTGIVATTGTANTTAAAYTAPLTTTSITVTVRVDTTSTNATTIAAQPVTFYTTWTGTAAGDVSPQSGITYQSVVTSDSNGLATYTITNASPKSGAIAAVTYAGLTTGGTVTVTWAKSTPAAISISPAGPMTVALKSVTKATFTVTDAFGAPVAGAVLNITVTGANAPATGTGIPSIKTDAAGQASYELTDAAAVAADTDAIKATSADVTSVTKTLTLTYAASIPTPASATLYFNEDESAVASTGAIASATTIYDSGTTAFALSQTMDTTKSLAAATAVAGDHLNGVVAKFKTSTGSAAYGIPVTVTASAGGWILSSAGLPVASRTVYTNSTGEVTVTTTASTPGSKTFTFTSGTVSKSLTVAYANTTANARFVSVTAGTDNTATVKVTDNLGNGVSGVTLSIGVTGATLAGGAISTQWTTDATGAYSFALASSGGGSAVVSVTASTTTADQLSDPAGYVGTTVVVDAKAAVKSASATVAVSATADSSTATDAAAEATDAANAATDAANAAAEAADAATAAAQDAADAVAALSAQVATLISGLKAQLTALTNLVIKIQKKVKA